MFQKQKGYKCAQCGCILNISKEAYKEHLENYHNKKKQPLKRMTLEEIATVVKRIEEGWLAPHLYVPSTLKSKEITKIEQKIEPVNEVPVAHDADCKCMACWNKLLDALLAKQEADLAAVEVKATRSESETSTFETLSTVLVEMAPIKVRPLEAGLVLQNNDVEWKG